MNDVTYLDVEVLRHFHSDISQLILMFVVIPAKLAKVAVVFRRQISKKPTISGKIVGFLTFFGEIQQLVRKPSQKNN